MSERKSLPLVLASACALFAARCTMMAGVDDYVEAPCEGPCADTAIADSTEDALEVAVDTFVEDTGTAPDVKNACDDRTSELVNVGGYGIDRTEVTNAQYAAFLARGALSEQDAVCAWNASFKPGGVWPAPEERCDHPVANVDWCDAAAYCKWAGKRLCGHRISGAVPFTGSGFTTAATDGWYNACSSNAANAYPYPGVYIARFCVDVTYSGKTSTKPVASLSTCQPTTAPYGGVFDLVGNVAEWEDSCDKAAGAPDHCRVRGGSYLDDALHAMCTDGRNETRDQIAADIGFRCCSK